MNKCPFTGKACAGPECIAWGNLVKVAAFDPKTGQPMPVTAGEGCTVFNKLIKEAKK